jgi:hypothetical protein
MARARATRDRVPSRGESHAEITTVLTPAAVERSATTTSRGAGAAARMWVHRKVATLVTPDTILRWHRALIARKGTYTRRRPGRPGVLVEIRRFVVRMATENPTWGYTRIQGALKNVGHRVARSTMPASQEQKASHLVASGRPRGARSSARIGCARGDGLFHDGSLDCSRVVTYYRVRHRVAAAAGARGGFHSVLRRRTPRRRFRHSSRHDVVHGAAGEAIYRNEMRLTPLARRRRWLAVMAGRV